MLEEFYFTWHSKIECWETVRLLGYKYYDPINVKVQVTSSSFQPKLTLPNHYTLQLTCCSGTKLQLAHSTAVQHKSWHVLLTCRLQLSSWKLTSNSQHCTSWNLMFDEELWCCCNAWSPDPSFCPSGQFNFVRLGNRHGVRSRRLHWRRYTINDVAQSERQFNLCIQFYDYGQGYSVKPAKNAK